MIDIANGRNLAASIIKACEWPLVICIVLGFWGFWNIERVRKRVKNGGDPPERGAL